MEKRVASYDHLVNKGDINLAQQHPGILQKMVSAYDKFAQDVGVIAPKDIENLINIINHDYYGIEMRKASH